MYQLHYFPANANAAPHMGLEAIGAKYGLIFVDRANDAQKSSEYLKIDPNGHSYPGRRQSDRLRGRCHRAASSIGMPTRD
jgi:hypothetical protein